MRLANPDGAAARELEVLARKAKSFSAGSDLCTKGYADEPYYLLSGWACWRFDLADGRRQIIQLVLPGDRLGGVACLHGGIAALTSVKMIPVSAVETLCLQDAAKREAGARLAVEAAHRGLVDQIIRLGQLSAYERMAHLILELRRRLVANTRTAKEILHFPLTQEALSNALGISVVHMNRVLQRLRSDRLIELGGGRLTILDLAGLEAASGMGRRSTGYDRDPTGTAGVHLQGPIG